MRLFSYRLNMNGPENETWTWHECSIIEGWPLQCERGYGGPFYVEGKPPGINDVKFDPDTKKLTLDHSFSYGIITKNAYMTHDDGSVEFQYGGAGVPKELKYLENAEYYYSRDKGGVFFYAVIP